MQYGLLPARIQHENCSSPVNSAGCGGAVQVPRRVFDKAAKRIRAVRNALEGIQYGFLAGGIDLEDCSTAGSSAGGRSAIEVSSRIEDKSRRRRSSVVSSLKRIHNSLLIGTVHFCEFKYSSITCRAPLVRSAVQRTVWCEDQCGLRCVSIRCRAETVQHRFLARQRCLENRSIVEYPTTRLGGSV